MCLPHKEKNPTPIGNGLGFFCFLEISETTAIMFPTSELFLPLHVFVDECVRLKGSIGLYLKCQDCCSSQTF